MKKKKTFKTPMMDSCMNHICITHYNSYQDMLKSKMEELKEAGKYTVGSYKNKEQLDDPDTAGQWILKNMKCIVKNGNYEMEINGKSGLSECDLENFIKNAEDLNFSQKCWVLDLLYAFNEAWMCMGPQKFEEYFRPIYAGQFGYNGREDIMELMKD